MVMAQDGRCAVCGRAASKLMVDHDHACCPGVEGCPRCVRGLLCGACNSMLGFARDDLATLRRAAEYLASRYAEGAAIGTGESAR
jgi:hypothetical protein